MRRVRGIVVLLAAAVLVIALPGIAQAQDHEPEGTNDVRITIVYDNTVYDGVDGISGDWGFSALIEIGEQQVLFDTGTKGLLLLENMAALDIDPSLINVIVLSHDHGDHTGGLETLLTVGEATPERIIVLPSVPESTKVKMAGYATVIDAEPGMVIVPGMISTGELTTGPFPEQAALIETADGVIVLTGCAHPGIVEIVKAAHELSDEPIILTMGGFHLLELNAAQVQAIIGELHALEVQQVAPSHCTGDAAIKAFAEDYGEDFVALGAGRILNYPAADEPAG